VSRYSVYFVLGAFLLLALLLIVGSDAASLVSAAVLLVLSATAAVLGYRNYRLERTATGWHRAIVRFLAGKSNLRFNAVDTAEVGRQLPDFAFFGGPRILYNVACNEADPHELIAFDFSCRRLSQMRDGVGCALQVADLSREHLSIRARGLRSVLWRWEGMRLPDDAEFMREYCVKAENEGRARQLLGAQVIEAISSWDGLGPPPWISVSGGMVGLSIARRYAGNDRAMYYFYEYGRKVRLSLERRLKDLRGEGRGSTTEIRPA
jgi:hypothetical protein